MERIEFPSDFSEFLKLLNAHDVEYLLVGGFAVAIHGYPRATADMDVWVARNLHNAERIVSTLREFGFDLPSLTVELFLEPDRIVRMGTAPIRIELLTSIDGVDFEECAKRSITQMVDGSKVRVIGLDDLKANKRARGRNKDLADLENLP
jgi:predicted nucleotidyltransferase